MLKKTLILFGFLFMFILIAAPGSEPVLAQDYMLPFAIEGTQFLKDVEVTPEMIKAAENNISGPALVEDAQCFGDGSFRDVITPSFDPDHPGNVTKRFWRETGAGATGLATLWVAWDDLEFGVDDPRNPRTVITCDQLDYLQGSMDSIVAADVYYFGEYNQRPAGNDNLDVMIYNIVDEFYYDPNAGSYIAGFFWGSLNDFMDFNMMFIDNWDWVNRLGPDVARPYLYEGTVAHELEHLIHYDHDADEPSWIDEGMADLAIYLNDLGHPDGHVVYALAFHRNSLTTWGGGLDDYGTSYLFQLYLLEQFGNESGGVWDNSWTRALVDQPLDGIAGIEAETGASFNDIYDAWVVANYLDQPGLLSDGAFPQGYNTIDLAPYNSPGFGPWSIEYAVGAIYDGDHHGNLPVDRYFGGAVSGQVEWPQGELAAYMPLYGTFAGMEPVMRTRLWGAMTSGIEPTSGSYYMSADNGNLQIQMLALNDPVGGTLTFNTWFDIEEDWDFGFVEVSTDGGSTWAPLAGDISMHSDNPFGSTAWANSLVAGDASSDAVFTGSSGGWVTGNFILPAASTHVRFSYYTDEFTNGIGWFIDDVSVDGFSDDFEGGSGDWTLDGWTLAPGVVVDNNWTAIGMAPFHHGQSDHYVVEQFDDDGTAGPYEFEGGYTSTKGLNGDNAAVVIANRPGVESLYNAFYQILVDKIGAGRQPR